MKRSDPDEDRDARAVAARLAAKVLDGVLAPVTGHHGVRTTPAQVPGGAGQADVGASPRHLAAASRIGRYIILDAAGEGGMGIVYRAHDPTLRRDVAVKILRHEERGHENQDSLLKEAHAIARLIHPNIVAVHDAAVEDGVMFLAMDLVDGLSMAQWLLEQQPSWRDVLDVMMDAGRGLEAAHDASIIHRDFKPDNVMVPRDGGEVRIVDFGLASADETRAAADGASSLGAARRLVTRDGVMSGTPAYMSPEQLRCENGDARMDQFSFCVTLWEGIYGERPFLGDSIATLQTNVLSGAVQQPPANRQAPRWLERVLRRGLSVEPSDRWPSMTDLLSELSRGQTNARRRTAVLGLGFVVVLACAGLGYDEYAKYEGSLRCRVIGGSIAETWNSKTRGNLHDALLGVALANARPTADKVITLLDAYADTWTDARATVCRNASVEELPGWDESIRNQAVWCLDEKRQEFNVLVSELLEGGPEEARRAVLAAAGLKRVAGCTEREVLDRLPLPPSGSLVAIAAVRKEFGRASALRGVGRYEEAALIAANSIEATLELEWPPIVADARARHGELLGQLGHLVRAEDALETAFFEAASAGAMDVAIEAAVELVFVLGQGGKRPQDALRWSRHAELLLADLPGPTSLHRAARLTNLAAAQYAAGNYVEVVALATEAVQVWQAELGANSPEVVNALSALGAGYLGRGKLAEARTEYERASSILADLVGGDHPNYAGTLTNLGAVRFAQGDFRAARALHERASRILEVTVGPTHPNYGLSLNNLANAVAELGDVSAALSLFTRALVVFESAFGPDHLEVATALDGLASAYRKTRRYDEALALLERALRIREKSAGSHHELTATTLNNLANVHVDQGRYEAAIPILNRALQIHVSNFGDHHPAVALQLHNLAFVHEMQGETGPAAKLYEKALLIQVEVLGSPHRTTCKTRVNLADVYEVEGRVHDALQLRLVAKQGLEAALGRDHPEVLALAKKIARVSDTPGEPAAVEARPAETLESTIPSAVQTGVPPL